MNRLIRICFVILAGLLSFLSGASANAQAWPSRSTIRILIPYPPGGASDVTARLLALKLTESLKQSVVVENKPGANGILALESVAKSPADGYTLLMANLGPNAINAAVYQKLPYDSVKDFTPITLTSVVPLVILVTNSLPVKTMPELIAYAKANPNKLSFASAGNGSANHLAGEMIKGATGVQMTHIPYKGDAPGMPDVISGTVSMMFPTIIGGMPNIKSGSMRPIAVTSAKRSSSLPDIPTVSESGIPGFDLSAWYCLMAPGGTPKVIVSKIREALIKTITASPVIDKLLMEGASPEPTTPDQLTNLIKTELVIWAKAVKVSGADQ